MLSLNVQIVVIAHYHARLSLRCLDGKALGRNYRSQHECLIALIYRSCFAAPNREGLGCDCSQMSEIYFVVADSLLATVFAVKVESSGEIKRRPSVISKVIHQMEYFLFAMNF